jgi:hypothetical protein
VGDKVFETEFLSQRALRLLEDPDESEISALQVSQVEKNKEILSTAE